MKENCRKVHWLIIFILIVSLMFNIICVAPYINGYYGKFREKYYPIACFDSLSNDDEVIDAVVAASLEMDGSAYRTSDYSGLINDVRSFFSSPNELPFNDAYLKTGLSYYALKRHEDEIVNNLISWGTELLENDKYSITIVDQAPVGIMFLNLYRLTGDSKYRNAAESIYSQLKDICSREGKIAYRQGVSNNYVDVVGMVVPFLVEYFRFSQEFGTEDSTAYKMAWANLEEYHKYCCDKETGIPAHGYNRQTHIKVGSANWGRGIGWYLLASAYLPEFRQPLLENNIKHLDYSQFPLSSCAFDSSTALMFEIYKHSIDPQRTKSLDFIKPYITQKGLVTKCSGDTYDLNAYSRSFGPAEQANGFLLMLISLW